MLLNEGVSDECNRAKDHEKDGVADGENCRKVSSVWMGNSSHHSAPPKLPIFHHSSYLVIFDFSSSVDGGGM
jgi:hypothetical protein